MPHSRSNNIYKRRKIIKKKRNSSKPKDDKIIRLRLKIEKLEKKEFINSL